MDGLIGKIKTETTVIPAAGKESGVIDLVALGQLSAIVTPAELTSLVMTFKASATPDGTFVPVISDGAEYTLTIAAGSYIVIDPTVFHGIPYLKLVTGSAEQAQRTFTVVGRNF